MYLSEIVLVVSDSSHHNALSPLLEPPATPRIQSPFLDVVELSFVDGKWKYVSSSVVKTSHFHFSLPSLLLPLPSLPLPLK
jgi:hypothetical protein